MSGAEAREVAMDYTVLAHATAYGADFRRSRLTNCDLSASKLNDSDFTDTDLSYARLNGTWMSGANLSNANLTGSSMYSARLDRANLTGARLYAANLSGWSIKGVRCEFVYWDVAGLDATFYELGEFERLHGSTTWVELTYPGGISTFEVNTLPAMIQHLAKQHPNAGIRLKSISESPGGVKVLLHVEDAERGQLEKINRDATLTQQAQLALRDDEITRLRIENELMLSKIFPRLLASAQQVNFAGAATNVIIAGAGSIVHGEQRIDNSEEIKAVVRAISASRDEAAPEMAKGLQEAAQIVQHELASDKPKAPLIGQALGVLKEIATKTAVNAGEKLITDNWQAWAHQLEHLIKALSGS